MRKSSLIVLLLLLVADLARAQPPYLVLTTDSPGIQDESDACRIVRFEPGIPVHGQILATPVPGGGIAGAEFMIELPADVILTQLFAAPDVSSSGSPFVGPLGGGVLALVSPCQVPTGQDVLLYDFTLMSAINGEYELDIVRKTNPSNPTFAGPVILDCTPQMVEAQQAYRAFAGPTTDPFPADQAVDVATDVVLTWSQVLANCGCAGPVSRSVYFGTDPDPPQADFWPDSPPEYDPGPLAANTTYYWRTGGSYCGASASGPVWSFTTANPIAVETLHWTQVKRLFR